MTTASSREHAVAIQADALFERVVCGIDGTPEGGAAAAQIGRLAPPAAGVSLCSVWNTGASVALGWSPPVARAPEFPQEEIRAAIRAARPLLPDGLAVDTTIVQGPPGPMLLTEAERRRATLVAVGSHGHRRLAGMLLGSVATQVLHECPCSVLIARGASGGERFPRTMMVGVDGSVQSGRALQVAVGLAARLGAELEAVVAMGGGDADVPSIRTAVEAVGGGRVELRVAADAAVAALAGFRPDLLVLGSRGLHGLRSLGSVSERVAHEAAGSVLVVR